MGSFRDDKFGTLRVKNISRCSGVVQECSGDLFGCLVRIKTQKKRK